MTLDPITPSAEVAIVREGTLFEAHGAYADEYTCSGYRFMSIADFKRDIVPNLYDTEAGGKFCHYIIRDLVNGSFYTVEPDGVYEFVVESMKQRTTADVIKKIREKQDTATSFDLVLDFNCSVPVVSYKRSSSLWEITLKIPETRTVFHHAVLTELNIPIYLPPLLYKVRGVRDSNVPQQTYICVLKEDSVLTDNFVLADLALPNIYSASSGCNICTGSSRFTDSIDFASMNPSQVACKALELLLSSTFNFDLFERDRIPSNTSEVFFDVYEKASEAQKKQIDKIFSSISSTSSKIKTVEDWRKGGKTINLLNLQQSLAAFICCLNDKNGAKKLEWKVFDKRRFLG